MKLRQLKPTIGRRLPAFTRPFYYGFIRKYETPLEQRLLLMLPFLYRTRFVNYEASMSGQDTDDLLALLDKCLSLEGDIIECGSDLFGSTILMANYSREKNVHKIIYGCDSFEGFARAELRRERERGLTKAPYTSFTLTSYEYVQKKIRKLGVEDTVVPIKGFFQDSLPEIKSKFCFAFIDCDLGASITYCAEIIFPRLASGGFIVFDDYTNEAFGGARPAIDSFVERRGEEISNHGLRGRWYQARKK